MDHDRRLSVVAAIIGLAKSSDYRDRADAGRAMAGFADIPEARERLLGLVLDAEDTYVTLVTAEALLRRKDAAGLAIVAEALTTADFQWSTQIHEAVTAVFMIFLTDRDAAILICEELATTADEPTRRGIGILREILAGIEPVLHPTVRPMTEPHR